MSDRVRHALILTAVLGAIGFAAATGDPKVLLAVLLAVILAMFLALAALKSVPWSYLLAGYVGLLMFVPVNMYNLPVSLPFDLEPQRLVLLILVLTWVASLLVDPQTRFRATGVEAPLLLLVFVAFASLAVNWPEQAMSGLLGKGVKAVVYLLVFIAAMYFSASAVRDRRDVDRLVMWLVGLAAVLAIFGVIERFTSFNPFMNLSNYIPVLVKNPTFVLDQRVLFRGGGLRVRSSAEHPIAFGAMLTLIAPFALYLSLRMPAGQKRTAARLATGLIIIAAMLTVSRTALLGLLVIGGILFLREHAQRAAIGALCVALAFAIHMAFPGLLGSFRSTMSPAYLEGVEFQNEEKYGRGWAYEAMMEQFPKKPVLGIGFNMLDPREYFYTDNQYLKLVGELGVAGTFAFIWLNASLVWAFWRAAKRRERGYFGLLSALTASCAAFAVMSFTYDTLGFPQASLLFFVIAGLGGAALAIEKQEPANAGMTVRA